jgi:hypothetical protein
LKFENESLNLVRKDKNKEHGQKNHENKKSREETIKKERGTAFVVSPLKRKSKNDGRSIHNLNNLQFGDIKRKRNQ